MKTEADFRGYCEQRAVYNAAIETAGGRPWWLDADKLAKLESRIPGISEMSPDDRRRALYFRHTK